MHRELEFSFFMMRRTTSRWGVHSMLYAAEPWAVIHGSLSGPVPPGVKRRAAESFVRQAREYFTAAERADTIETRPLLYHYSFLNLGKALAIAGGRALVGKFSHGVAHVGNTGHAISSSELQFQRSGTSSISALDGLHRVLEGQQLPAGRVPVAELVAQSVVAHRLWREAANRKERFLAVDRVLLRHDGVAKSIWATLEVRADTMKSRGRGISETVTKASLSPAFRAVADSDVDGVTYRNFEQVTPIVYQARPSDKVMDVVLVVRPRLWQTVTSAPPYRRYYLYLSGAGGQRHPQWLSIYTILFWLGSLTRYQPVDLLELLEGPYGAFFREFLATQPSQLLYILASEFKHQDVARAAVV